MPSKHATGQLATSSNAPRSALCANDVLGRCPSHTAARPKKEWANATPQTPTSSRRFGAPAQHRTISSTLQPFFHGLCPAPFPSLASCPPARRGQAVEILWAIRERPVHRMGHPRCCGWQLLCDCLASCRQAVDKAGDAVSSNAALQRRPPPLPRTSRRDTFSNERKGGYAKRENATVGLSRRQRNPTIRALRTWRQANPRRVVSSAGRAADF